MAPTRAHMVAAAAAAALVLSVAAGPVMVPAALHAAGFGAHGIAAGSWAAAFMKTYGGLVPKDSLFAAMQRVGARGLTTPVTAAMEGTAIAMAAALALVLRRFFSSKNELLGLADQLPSSTGTTKSTTDLIQQKPKIKRLPGPPPICVDSGGNQYRQLPIIDDAESYGSSTSSSDDEDDDAGSSAPLLRTDRPDDESQGAEEAVRPWPRSLQLPDNAGENEEEDMKALALV